MKSFNVVGNGSRSPLETRGFLGKLRCAARSERVFCACMCLALRAVILGVFSLHPLLIWRTDPSRFPGTRYLPRRGCAQPSGRCPAARRWLAGGARRARSAGCTGPGGAAPSAWPLAGGEKSPGISPAPCHGEHAVTGFLVIKVSPELRTGLCV